MSQAPVPAAWVALAHEMADTARAIVLRHYRAGLHVEMKSDASPVTAADREVETAVRGLIHDRLPDHGVIGEEHGAERADAEHVWVIDPIDGTKAFILGIPVFGILVALTRRGAPILGVIDQPVTGERWVGGVGWPTELGGRRVHVRECASIGAAALCSTSTEMFTAEEGARFERLRADASVTRFGTDCYGYGVLATGLCDLVVESDLALHDYLAPAAVVEAAGGICTDWEGRPLTIGLGAHRVLAAGDRRLHDYARRVLSGA
ncbi:MAG: inositol monophosphatase family protein [Ectothiorhodospiraceae bacterium]|nr:inositol monophosphatase family protein [Chromatiales bacterium]MCP5155983.1 inositol monophosphatase family protein [Ectothiorhodospiraceae bacterium]